MSTCVTKENIESEKNQEMTDSEKDDSEDSKEIIKEQEQKETDEYLIKNLIEKISKILKEFIISYSEEDTNKNNNNNINSNNGIYLFLLKN